MATHRWRFIGIVISAVCLMIGTCLAVTGVRKTTLDISAPLPTAQWTIPASVLPVPQPSPSGQALVMGGKNRLFIPELSVSAPVVTATVDVAGSLSVPADPAAVGIADSGAALSDNAGSTVLAGHVNMDHQRGALWDLATVTPGASITAARIGIPIRRPSPGCHHLRRASPQRSVRPERHRRRCT